MTVEELYKLCDTLMKQGRGKFAVTIEMENSIKARELIRDGYVISFKTTGLLVLQTGCFLEWGK